MTAYGRQNHILEVSELSKHFPLQGGFFDRTRGTVKAVDGVGFAVRRGETLGIVGESGCGKTTTGRMIMQVLEPTAGRIIFRDDEQGAVDLCTLTQKQLRPLRSKMQMVFQNPYSSLDPRMTIQQIVGEPLRAGRRKPPADYRERIAQILTQTGLSPDYMNRYPHAFSGGQRQRIGIARALVTRPRLVVADEPVSALDVSVQAQILNLLKELQDGFGLTYIFIAHDLSVIRHMCDTVAIMYLGRLVELGSMGHIFERPAHPYTEGLLSIMPGISGSTFKRKKLRGMVADAASIPAGCAFHPRCPYARDICRVKTPELEAVNGDHLAACHFKGEIPGP